MTTKERIRLRQSWTAPPTKEDLDYLDAQSDHEAHEADNQIDDDED